MAKELEISNLDELFTRDVEADREESIRIAGRVLTALGGYGAIANSFPFDRGEANKLLVMWCLRAAEQTTATYAGSPRQPERVNEIVGPVEAILESEKSAMQSVVKNAGVGSPATITSLVIHEYVAGDKYVASQAAAQGPRAPASGVEFYNRWKEIETSVDLSRLANQLAQLREENESRDLRDLARLGEAEKAARPGDGPTALAKLASVGKWALDAATLIGAGLAVEALKKACGL